MIDATLIKKNSGFSFVSIISRQIANTVLVIIIVNNYEPGIAAYFGASMFYATLLLQFADFGIDLLLTTEIAKNRDKSSEIFCKLLPVKLFFAAASILVLIIIALINGAMQYETRVMTIVLSLYTAFTLLNNYFSALFKGFERLSVDAKVSLAGNLFLLVMVFLFSILKLQIFYISLIYVVSRLFNLVQSYYYSKQFIPKIKLIYDWNYIKAKKNILIDFGANMFFGNIFAQWDSLFLQNMKGDKAFMLYRSASLIFSVPIMFLDVLINAFTPSLARLNSRNKSEWVKLGFILNKLLVFLSIPIAFWMIIYPEQIIKIIYFNKDYSGAINILRLFGVFLIVRFFTDTSALMLTTGGNQNKRMRIVVVATLLSIPLYIYCINVFGVIGSIIAHLIANTLTGLIFILASVETASKYFIERRIIMVISISVPLGIVVWIFKSVSMFVTMPVFVLMFCIVVYCLGFNKEERGIIIPDIKKILTRSELN